MIVRKYRERKRGMWKEFGKEQNKKDLMAEFQTEMGGKDWYRCGTRYEEGRQGAQL
jgi:hypothetical protein